MGPVDRPSKAAELVPERSLVHLRRRRELGAEDSDTDASKASQRPKSVPVAPRQLDGGMPVRVDAQLLRGQPPAPVACNEGHRNPLEAARPPLEEPLRRIGFHAADVDAVDLHAGGDPLRRAREDEPERGADHGQDQESERAALDAHARRGLPLAPGSGACGSGA